MSLVYGSVCSGVEAASLAWRPLGWRPAFFSEIDPFPRAVLERKFNAQVWEPCVQKNGIPLRGDFTEIRDGDHEPIDLLVGGTPCQSFSIAGKRLGMDDPRGNLALEFLALARRLRTSWLVWENVPGVLSSFSGSEHAESQVRAGRHGTVAEGVEDRDFALFLSFLRECGYGFAYRVLDAQYVRVDGFARAVPQRRRRVILVGYLGDWRPAAAVLLEPEGMRGDPAPSRETGQSVAALTAAGVGTCGADDNQAQAGHLIGCPDVSPAVTSKWPAEVAPTLNAHFGEKMGLEDQHALNGAGLFVPGAHTLSAEGFDASEDGTGRGTPLVPVVGFHGSQDTIIHGDKAGPVARNQGQENCIAFHKPVATQYAVRRLTPRECERLQGFPDDHTMIPWRGKPAEICPDGPRYKAIGNSMSVNVMRWVGQRIDMMDTILKSRCEAAE